MIHFPPSSNYALSIVLIGVGDGPWEAMYYFDDNIKQRNFDNFQVGCLSFSMESKFSSHMIHVPLFLLSVC